MGDAPCDVLPTWCGRRARGWRPPGRVPYLLARALPGDEGQQALVVLGAGRASLKVRVHARELAVRLRVLELGLDVAIELVEAMLAGQLGLARSEQARQLAVRIVWLGHGRLPSPGCAPPAPRRARRS